MRAIVMHAPGGPEVFQIEEAPLPETRPGWVRIRVKAFGLNRSELFTRRGDSPSVRFPRVLGIECVGIVNAAGADTPFQEGQTVAAAMGEMGRAYDGGYAEYTLVPAKQVMPLTTDLPWDVLAAIPETWLTADGSLDAMDLRAGQSLVIRGGTSSVGMAALALAKDLGATVMATTRDPQKVAALRAAGADCIVLDSGAIADEVRRLIPGGAQAVLELVGATTLRDSLQALAPKGIVCFTGILGNRWTVEQFTPGDDIPSSVRLTTYGSGQAISSAISTPALQRIVDGVAAGRYRVNLDRVFPFEQIVDAHRYMEENRAVGKVVVTVA